jgi:mono/diheme cytochrome c family protein
MRKRLNIFREVRGERLEVRGRKKRSKLSYVLLLTSYFLLLTACRDHTKPPWEYMPSMVETPSGKAQEWPMRTPPAGTIPIGFKPYPYTKDQGDLAGAELKNPLSMDKAVFLRGQQVFNTYCIVCHGERGLGDGYIVPKFPRPPTLQSDKVRNWSDGRIYHVITTGQNLMPSYATQILPEDRWAVIRYLRVLQRAEKPTPEDIEIMKAKLKKGEVL